MRRLKNLQPVTTASILIASFIFLCPGAGVSQADGYARHFKPAHSNSAHVKSASKYGYHNNGARARGKQFTQRVVTTTRYYKPRGATQYHGGKHYNSKGFKGSKARKQYRKHNTHIINNSFTQHQKLRHKNFKAQRRAQQYVRHNLGMFTALPGISINIPL